MGGAEVNLFRTIQHLKTINPIVCVLTGRGEIALWFEKNKIPIYYLNINGGINFFKIFFYFKNIIKKERPQLLITYLPLADMVGRVMGLLLSIKTVCFARSKMDEKRYNKFFFIEKITSWLIHHYFAVSQGVKEAYIKKTHIKDKKITVIYNGIDTQIFSPATKEEKQQIKASLQIKEQQLIIGTISKLRKEKGVDMLLRAWQHVTKKINQAKLVIIGDGPEEQSLLSLTQQLNINQSVIFLGKRNDTAKLLKGMDIFVMSSQYEGMSNAILEAMSSGLPIIATNTPENNELIQNEHNGLLMEQYSSQSLAQCIIKLINDPAARTRYGLANRQKAKNYFDINQSVALFETEIAKLLNT